MYVPGRDLLWVARAASLATASSGLAWVGHTVSGREPASLDSFAAGTILMGLLLARFTRRQWGFGEIFAVLSAAQVGLHLVFSSGALPLSGPGHHASPLPLTLGYSPGMLLGHLCAALLGTALLSQGETALWTLCTLITAALPRLHQVQEPVAPTPAPQAPAPVAEPAPSDTSPPNRPRGPPPRVLPSPIQ